VVKEAFSDAFNYMKNGTLLRQVINKLNEIDFADSNERHLFGDIYEQILKDLQSAGNAGEFYTPRAVTRFIVQMIDPQLGETIFDPACGTGGFLACSVDHVESNYVKTAEDHQALQQQIRGVEKKQLPHLLCTTNMLLHGIEVPVQIKHGNTLSKPLSSWDADVDVIVSNPPFGGERPCRRGPARRHPVWRGGKNQNQEDVAGRVQPAYHRAPAQLRVRALYQYQDQYSVF
jgi:type I restriction enzyme M protein